MIQGIAVAGNAGGTGSSDGGPGETEPYSQTIRFEDGSCRGWTPEDRDGPSTEGLEAGASVTIRDDAGEEIGGGSVESSTSFPVDENGNRIDEDQGTATWRCEFFFSANLIVSEPPSVVFLQVAGLEPWAASFDPARNQFVAIVPGTPDGRTGGTAPPARRRPPAKHPTRHRRHAGHDTAATRFGAAVGATQRSRLRRRDRAAGRRGSADRTVVVTVQCSAGEQAPFLGGDRPSDDLADLP